MGDEVSQGLSLSPFLKASLIFLNLAVVFVGQKLLFRKLGAIVFSPRHFVIFLFLTGKSGRVVILAEWVR